MEYANWFIIVLKAIYALVMVGTTITAYRALSVGVSPGTRTLWHLLAGICLCEAIAASEVIFATLYTGGVFTHTPMLEIGVTGCRRLTWVVNCILYLLITMFFEQLIKKIPYRRFYRLCTFVPALLPIIPLLSITILNATVIDVAARNFEFIIYGYVYYYVLGTLIFLLAYAWYINRYEPLPRLVKKQLTTCAGYLLLPHVCCILLTTNYHTITSLPFIPDAEYFWITLNEITFMIAFIYTIHRLFNLRLFGLHAQIQRHKTCHFVQDLKYFLIDISKITTTYELATMIKNLFAHTYKIRHNMVELYVRPVRYAVADMHHQQGMPALTLPAAEQFLQSPRYRHLLAEIAKRGVLIRDEIEFDYFYEEDAIQKDLITLLNQTCTDVFIPIYDHIHLIGYVTIAQNARPHELFSNIERDEMLVYANHLSVVIHLLQSRSIKELILKDKEAQEELYTKQQEINHYKESIRNLLYSEHETTIGIGLYYGKKITWMSDGLRSLLHLETDDYKDTLHYAPLVQLCSYAAQYGTQRSLIITDDAGKQVNCTALPCPQEKLVIVIARYADRSETLALPFARLSDIAKWEYALYLQTTESGKLINQIIPAHTSDMLNFKIELLKASMSRKALLLELPDDDLQAVVNIIHHISMRSTLQTLEIDTQEQADEYGLMLYGMEAAISPTYSKPLLTTLHNTGTLFIKNIDLLSIASQERLAEFITTGMFRPLLSDRQIQSNVRIICSIRDRSEHILEIKEFSESLRMALYSSKLCMPSLISLSRDQLENIARTITDSALHTTEFKDLIDLNKRDIDQLVQERPTSMHKFQQKIRSIIQKKSQQKRIEQMITLDDEQPHAATPAEILRVIRMGKRALHQRKTLLILWNHFQSQAKIAQVLKVNRSSVHRRCKDFNIALEIPTEHCA